MHSFDLEGKMNPFLTKHEDLIWAIRQSTETRKNRNSLDIRPAASMLQFHKDNRIQLLGSLVPDEVMSDVDNFTPSQFSGSILYCTIYGLPKISDIYNQPMKGGPIRFTKVLNEYFGGIVEEILAYEGDVLNLYGDSFLALWKSPEGCTPNDEVHVAINCALSIQKHCGKFEAAGVDVQMKMTITAGVMVFSLIGDEVSAHYICIGRPIDDQIEAQEKCAEDDIIVAPSAWMYIKLAEYNAFETEDGAHFKVIGIGPNWHLTRKDYTMKRLQEYENISSMFLQEEEVSSEELLHQGGNISMRPILQRSKVIQMELHKFMTVQILDFLEDDEPLERLIEMRYVVVMYINIVMKKCKLRATVSVVDQCYQIIDKNARQYKGIILRVTLLNKDIKFIVIFGLRGSTNISECKQALNCSVICQQKLNSTAYVQAVSVACSSGKSYCGIFGHTWRKKYDVMGVCIHKAAKMLTTYPDRITCDRKIFLNSQLEASNFILMDYKKLEGVINQGLIYEYSEGPYEDLSGSILKFPLNNHTTCPILGREMEVRIFEDLFLLYVEHFPNCLIRNGVIIQAFPKQGKSRLLVEFLEIARSIATNEIILGKEDFLDSYGCIRRILEPFLAFGHYSSKNKRKEVLRESAQHSDEYLCCLNAVFDVDFSVSGSYESFTADEKTEILETIIDEICRSIQESLISEVNIEEFSLPTIINALEFNSLTENWSWTTDLLDFKKLVLCYIDKVSVKLKFCIKIKQNFKVWCFKEPTLISIDNADLMDEESWKLLPVILRSRTFFFTAALTKQKLRMSKMRTLSKISQIVKLSLKKIPKMYQASIACQILAVYAIPADLENAIQNYSNGNPGWIENFMITLLQAKKLFIRSMDFKKIHDSGLVAPPLYMLRRLTSAQINRYKILLEEKDEFADDSSKLDQWNVFIDSCRDEFTNVAVKKEIHKILGNEMEMRVCCITNTFNVALDVDPEISDDMSILELYDSMSYQEQQMLSCASVLGDLFTRRFLCYMWSPDSQLLAGTVVQTLFEKGVLCCARGDFSSGGDYILQRDNMIDPSKDKAIECYCIGMDMDDSCIFMPTYASCGYMRFRSTKFRSIIYDLIPDNQRREMHVKAAKYIQKETKRCVSCGTAYFPEKQVCRLDMTPVYRLSDTVKKKKTLQLEQMNFEELCDYSNVRFTGGSGSSKEARQSVIPSLRASSVMKSYVGSLTSNGMLVEEYQSPYAKTPNVISPLTIYRLKERPSLVRTFSKLNFVSCECHLILGHMHKRLKYHYREAGEWNKMIRCCISLAKLSVSSQNYTTAMKAIDEAVEVLHKEECILGEPKWKIDMYLGILHSLSGRVLICYNQEDEAYEKFLEAMKTFKVPFPVHKRNISFHLKLLKQKWSQKMGLYFFPKFIVEDGDENEFQVMNCMSDSLCHLCRIFIGRGEWKLAELAAVWSLRNSLQTETSLLRICESFQLMITIAQHYRNKLLSVSLEYHALRYCHKKTSFVAINELKAVARLYYTIFEARFSRAEFDNALQMSYIALNIAASSNEIDTCIHILVILPTILLRKMHIREMVSMMHELEFYANELEEAWGRMWYYSLCVIFNLETGYTFISFNAIESFYGVEGAKPLEKNEYAKMFLVTTMWLWYVRGNYWEAASLLDKEIANIRKLKIICSHIVSIFIYILEGTLLTLVNKINKRSITGKAKAKKEVGRILKKLHGSKAIAPSLTNRLFHLEAYYAFIMKNEDKMKKMLQKTERYSLKHGLSLELLHMEHSQKTWNKEISVQLRDFWKNHCTSDTCISYNDIDFDNIKIYSFSYPTPIFKS